jgi:DNA-binding CsgD family transcriptional regulator/tetratricopeptide (TPR) repeat protein
VISRPVLCRTFVGRTAELEHLVERRRAAAAGRGGAVLVAGEAGIGKSRLLEEFRRSLPKRTTRVAVAACRQFAQRPLGPLLDLLAMLDPQAGAKLAAGGFASKAGQMSALVETFERLAEGSTTIVCVEDLHWGDPDVVQVLFTLSALSSAQRLLFVGSYRDDEIVPGHPLFALLGKMLRERSTSLVRLAPLSEREMTAVLGDARRAAPQLPDGVVRDVRRRADGNVLFAEELLRHAADRATGDGFDSPLPLSLHAIVHERLERCTPGDRELLVRASLIGRAFDIESLAGAFDLPPGWCREAMARLGALQLVDRTSEEPAQYRFRHALTRDAVYNDIAKEAVAPLHLRIADAIAASGAADEHVEWLAHHYALAGERERAAEYAMTAGDAAHALHAYEDAALWYERAADGFDADCSAGALAKAGLMHVLGGHVERALTLYERASRSHEAAGRYEDAIAVDVMAAGALHDNGRVDDAIALLDEAKDSLGPRAGREVRDRLLVRLGFLYAFARRTDEAWAVAAAIRDETLDAFTPLGAEANFLRSALHAQRAEPELWRNHLDRGLEVFDRIDALADNVRTALGNAGVQALALGDVRLALAYQTRALEKAREINSSIEYESYVLAEIELQRGNFEAARAMLRVNCDQTKFNARVQRTVVAATLAALCADDASAALVDTTLLDEAVKGGQSAAVIKLSTVYGALFEFAGRTSEATVLLESAARTISTAYDMIASIALIALIRPNLAAGLKSVVKRSAARPEDRLNQALLALLEAAAAKDAGAAGEALTLADVAARAFAELEWPLARAYAFEAGGDAGAALKQYRSLGAHEAIRRLERRLNKKGGSQSAQSLLTPRERDIAGAIAAGKSNRDAAAAFSVSEKAVEKHLTSIYAKLGMTSRAQLAAYFAR